MLSTFSSQERTQTNFLFIHSFIHCCPCNKGERVCHVGATLVLNRKMDVADFTKCISLFFKTSGKNWKFFFPGCMKLVWILLCFSTVHFSLCLSLPEEDKVRAAFYLGMPGNSIWFSCIVVHTETGETFESSLFRCTVLEPGCDK